MSVEIRRISSIFKLLCTPVDSTQKESFFLIFDHLFWYVNFEQNYKAFVAGPALPQFPLKCIPEPLGESGSLYCLSINCGHVSDYENWGYLDLNVLLFKSNLWSSWWTAEFSHGFAATDWYFWVGYKFLPGKAITPTDTHCLWIT